jgi:tetratricopeptide (TPR) repeat protein
MGAEGGPAHDHGATGVDVAGEIERPARSLGATFLIVGALLLSGGLWLLSRSRSAAPIEPDLPALEEAARQKPLDAEVQGALARALLAAGRTHEARARFERLCALVPDMWQPRLELAHACLELGDRTAARAALDAALALAPEEPALREFETRLGPRTP